MNIAANVAAADLSIVEFGCATSRLRLVVEVEESEAILAFSLFVDADDGSLDIEAESLDVFEQIELVIVLGKVADEDRRKALLWPARALVLRTPPIDHRLPLLHHHDGLLILTG